MFMSELVKELSLVGFEVVGIEKNKVEVKRLWNNGKGYQREVFEVNEDNIIHLGVYEDAHYETVNILIDITIGDNSVKEYIKERL